MLWFFGGHRMWVRFHSLCGRGHHCLSIEALPSALEHYGLQGIPHARSNKNGILKPLGEKNDRPKSSPKSNSPKNDSKVATLGNDSIHDAFLSLHF